MAAAYELGIAPIILDVTGEDIGDVGFLGNTVAMSADEVAKWVMEYQFSPKFVFDFCEFMKRKDLQSG